MMNSTVRLQARSKATRRLFHLLLALCCFSYSASADGVQKGQGLILQGRPVLHWLEDFKRSPNGEAAEVFEAAAEQAAPFLCEQLDNPSNRFITFSLITWVYQYNGVLPIERQVTNLLVPAALKFSRQSTNIVLQKRAIWTLGGFGPWAGMAVTDLVDIIGSSPDKDVQRFSILALGKIDSYGQSVPRLVELLKNSDESIRAAALSAIISIGPRARNSVPEIISLLKTEQSPALRQKAEAALEEMVKVIPPLKGDEVSDFTAPKLLEVGDIALTQFRGRVVVIESWGTQCPPCQPAMAKLSELFRRKSAWKDKVVFIGLNIDEDRAKAVEHSKARNWTNILHLWDGAKKSIYSNFRSGLPELFLIDQKGKLVWRGNPRGFQLEENINALLVENGN